MKKNIFYIFGFLFALTAILACNGYKTPPPEVISTQVDGFRKFFKIGDKIWIVTKKDIQNIIVEKNGSITDGTPFKPTYVVENVTANGDYLYLQATDGLHIFNTRTNEENVHIKHILPCHEVRVKDNLMYVLKGGTFCKDSASEGLKVYNIEFLDKIKFAKFIPFQNPEEFVFADSLMYVQTAKNGIYGYNIANVSTPKQLFNISDVKGVSMSVNKNNLIVTDTLGVTSFQINADGGITKKYSILK